MHFPPASGPVSTGTPEIGVIQPRAFGISPISPAIALAVAVSLRRGSLAAAAGTVVFETLEGLGAVAWPTLVVASRGIANGVSCEKIVVILDDRSPSISLARAPWG